MKDDPLAAHTRLPRGTCHECGRSVTLRRGGLLREHAPANGGERKCGGSGVKVKGRARPPKATGPVDERGATERTLTPGELKKYRAALLKAGVAFEVPPTFDPGKVADETRHWNTELNGPLRMAIRHGGFSDGKRCLLIVPPDPLLANAIGVIVGRFVKEQSPLGIDEVERGVRRATNNLSALLEAFARGGATNAQILEILRHLGNGVSRGPNEPSVYYHGGASPSIAVSRIHLSHDRKVAKRLAREHPDKAVFLDGKKLAEKIRELFKIPEQKD